MSTTKTQRRRCATYTRKSSEEGLEQDFNSLDAQREACEAYIRSQIGEGWQPVRARYDDGGYSGGSLERPALSQLLSDIEAGKLDTVVVYKVDRLTRSLTDFAKIVEVLDAHSVSFVSVTQQFNTTTSMGRLTLNMLLSFAQFEREVTGERIRDKIAASKRKGLWMGGHVPLGYEPNGRTLKIVEHEAKTVRTLFRLYLELGSVPRVKEEADRLGLKSKIRLGDNQKNHGGRFISRGHIYRILNNPLYAGRIGHKGDTFDGQHPSIVDVETWKSVQKQLADQAPARSPQTAASTPSPLRGKLFEDGGAMLTPSHTVKSGRRYRYYVSRDSTASTATKLPSGDDLRWRLSARDVEESISKIVIDLLGNPSELARLARVDGTDETQIADLLARVQRWSGNPFEVIRRVDLATDGVTVHVDLREFIDGEEVVIRHIVPARMQRRGVEKRFVLYGGKEILGAPRADPTLLKAIVRARQWLKNLTSGEVGSLQEISKMEGISDRYVGALIPLAFLAPEIVSSIVTGTQSVELTTETLVKRIELPMIWEQQKTLTFSGRAPTSTRDLMEGSRCSL